MKYHLKTKGFKVREENSNQSLHWNIQCQSKWKDSKSKIEKYILNLDELGLSLTYNKDENDKVYVLTVLRIYYLTIFKNGTKSKLYLFILKI